MDLPRLLAPVVALGVATVPVLTNVTGSPATAAPAATAGCHKSPNTRLLTHAPKVTRLPGGAELRVWDSGGSDGGMGLRISEVYVPHNSPLHVQFLTSGAVTRSKDPTSVLRQHTRLAALSNGDVFLADRGAIPQGQEVINGKVVKATNSAENVLAVSKDGQLRGGMLHVTGKVAAGGRTEPISGLNWQTLTGSGIDVYTHAWGTAHRPAGSVDVVVKGGKVIAKRRSGLGKAPARGTDILTATGAAAGFLGTLHVGQKVTVAPTFHFDIHSGEAPIRVWEAINHDAPWLLQGKAWPVICTAKNETRMARTGIGWDQRGDVMLVTASGPQHGRIAGGATAANMEYYFRKLGAYNADGYDCDTSTTLAVRTLHGAIVRQDHGSSYYQRPVPNYIAIGP